MGMQNGAAVVEDGLVVAQMVKHKVTMWSSNSTLRYVSKVKTYINTKTYIQMFTEALYIMVKKVKTTYMSNNYFLKYWKKY